MSTDLKGAIDNLTEEVFNQGLNAASTRLVTTAKLSETDDARKTSLRSKTGCVNCKIRKKRCDEVKPVCGDCLRLKRNCTWISPEMSVEEVKRLRRQVEIVEETSKSRKRRKKQPPTMKSADTAIIGSPQVLVESSPAVKVDSLAQFFAAGSASASPLSMSPFLMNFEAYLDTNNGVGTPNNSHHHRSPQLEELDLDSTEGDALRFRPQTSADPVLYYTPSVNQDLIGQLDSAGLKLYDYFRNRLATIISIVPQEENLYLKTFLPMAHKDSGVLYGILAWSAFHSHSETEGNEFLQKSLTVMRNHNVDHETMKHDEVVNLRIANYLILCAAEICRGDVSHWSYMLQKCAELIKLKGIRNFNDSETRHWLVTNFAYHDIMTSSIIERGILFSLEDYNQVFSLGKFGMDPLHGLSKPLFQLIGEISNFAMNFNKMLKMTNETLSDNSYKSRYELLRQMNSTLKKIDREIDQLKPNLKDLYKLSSEDIELQLTLFESYQLTSKLHLRQSIAKMSPKTIEIQALTTELLRCIDIVLGTSVESSLIFPLFILGINLSDPSDRELILCKFEDYNKRYQFGNVLRLKLIMQEVWNQNDNGEKCIDWYEIVKKLGWELSFA